ncbi:hypothetical protein IGI04_007370 [Brassica rapa subsp. trilocularis]|uniref:Uncharacterized protein n=2 Tax=Brassica rapa subsp. trilocularis TaxID=1813537 RepID=A0ABQ7NLL1_BRACM|nr:hypothetical protein IGI04_007370 [Brassica rapa subsp. trilocularis]
MKERCVMWVMGSHLWLTQEGQATMTTSGDQTWTPSSRCSKKTVTKVVSTMDMISNITKSETVQEVPVPTVFKGAITRQRAKVLQHKFNESMILASDLGQVKLADEPSLKQDELKGAEPVKEKQASREDISVHPDHPCVRSAPSLLLGNSLVAYMGAPSSRNNDQDFIRKADIDALIKMFKDNGNINGYSYGASMIARTVGDLDCITRTDSQLPLLIMGGKGVNQRQLKRVVEHLVHMIKMWK